MKHRLAVPLSLVALLLACNSVTVVPIDDEEDAGDAGRESSTSTTDASTDADAASTIDAAPDVTDASDDG